MMSVSRGRVLLWASYLLASSALGAERLAIEQIPVPSDAEVRVVARDLVQHGLPVDIASLTTSQSLDATLDFYREIWPERSDGPGHLESRVDDWTIISHLNGDQNVVVQLRDDSNGTTGLISIMSLQVVATPSAASQLLPPGGEQLSTTTTKDIGTSATTSVVESPDRPGVVSAHYKDTLQRAGWSLVSERVVSGQIVLMLQQTGAWIELIVSDEESAGSLVVLNEVRLDA